MRRALRSAAVVLATVTVVPALVWMARERRRAEIRVGRRQGGALLSLSEELCSTTELGAWSATRLQRDTARMLRMRGHLNHRSY